MVSAEDMRGTRKITQSDWKVGYKVMCERQDTLTLTVHLKAITNCVIINVINGSTGSPTLLCGGQHQGSLIIVVKDLIK